MNCNTEIAVIAYADSGNCCPSLGTYPELNIRHCRDLESFLDEMLENDFSGVILEMKKVMSTPANDRNKIFALAAGRPMMRIRGNGRQTLPVDDPVCFRNDCMQRKTRSTRLYERVPVSLQVQLSHEDDHVMAREFYANVENLSEAGCFITTETDLSANRFVHMRFHDISNKLPVYGAIRWSAAKENGKFGYGLQFVKISDDQKQELIEKHISPNLLANSPAEIE
ncbi:PilZ domain-containing protein [Maridesulfovibrio sp.]|uniref:PilZ domain-containing protein n=1 Tax=Maridesulfovibrio sp. TaxID=2795000 RepID=UPI002A186DC1|nr:PilZ domain-containing protein [Maridesulfovibrio sp.]